MSERIGWTNFHGHSDYCDGRGTLTEYIETALTQDVLALGFSSHAPLPFETDWAMTCKVEDYCAAILRLKQLYQDRIPLFTGLEIDYFSEQLAPQPLFQHPALDYTIGSIHYLGIDTKTQLPWTLDFTPDSFQEGLDRIFHGQIKSLVTAYFQAVREMVNNCRPDIIGHLDLVKKFNRNSRFFTEEEDWYREAVYETLDTISKQGGIIEINTGGMSRGWLDSQYPATWILTRCRDLNIPLMLNSDCHQPNHLTYAFSETAKLLLSMGITHLMSLTHSGWQPFPLTPHGLSVPC